MDLFEKIKEKFRGLELEVVPITNHFFGEKITVSGLITGQDLIAQLKGRDGDALIIPRSMMKADVEEELGMEVIVSKVEGKDIINKLIGVS